MPEKYYPKSHSAWAIIKIGDKLCYRDGHSYGNIIWIDHNKGVFHLDKDTSCPKFNYTFAYHSNNNFYFIRSKPRSYKNIFIESLLDAQEHNK